jgi:hypothetical protein
VIRKFLDLAPSGARTLERRIPDEHRLFFWQGRIVCHAPYHDIGDPLEDVSPSTFVPRRAAHIARPSAGSTHDDERLYSL